MAEKSPRLDPVAHQSLNAQASFSNSNGGGDLTVKGGDHAFYGPRLTTLCSAAVQLVGGGRWMSNNAFSSSRPQSWERGESLKRVVGHELPEEELFSAMRAVDWMP
jgi:hypothetical protein